MMGQKYVYYLKQQFPCKKKSYFNIKKTFALFLRSKKDF